MVRMSCANKIMYCAWLLVVFLMSSILFDEERLYSRSRKQLSVSASETSVVKDLNINIAAVVCHDEARLVETFVNFKSVLLHTSQIVTFHLFTEEKFFEDARERFQLLRATAKTQFVSRVHPIQYPGSDDDDEQAKQWKKLFKPCASQRLFLPQILASVDSLLYVDTDVVFLAPVEDLWLKLNDFNATQLATMAAEHEHTNVAWYSRFARHPYYGSTGINSGIMLMNMTRMRTSKFKNNLSPPTRSADLMSWSDMLLPLLQKYNRNITWGDQDLLNIIFHFNPEMLMELPCDWNYRPDHCMYMPLCKSSSGRRGVQALHGCRRAFHNEKWPIFRVIYESVRDYDFNKEEDRSGAILRAINRRLPLIAVQPCSSSAPIILQSFTQRRDDDDDDEAAGGGSGPLLRSSGKAGGGEL